MRKSVLPVAVLATVLAATGCSSSSSSKASAPSASTEASPAAATSTTGASSTAKPVASPSAAASTGSTAPTSAAVSSDSGTVSVVGYKGGGTELANIPQLNAAFQAQYPNIKLTYKYVDGNDYDSYVNPRLAAGNAPDVLMADKGRINQWVKQGYLADLSDQPWVNRMSPNLKPFNSVSGKTYLLTSEVIPVSLFANLDLLKKAGINQVPQTWPDFLAALQTLKSKGIGGLELPDKGGWTGEQFFLDLGANLVPQTWATGYDTGSSHWAPTWGPVVDQIKQLVSTGGLDGKLMLGLDPNSDGLPLFETGKYAFDVQGAWNLSEFAKNAKFSFTMNPLPGGPAGSQAKAFVFVGTSWGVNAHSKNAQAAKDYVNFMSQPANESLYLKGEAAFSPMIDVESPAISQGAPIAAAFKAGDTSPSAIEVLNYGKGESEIQTQVQKIFGDPTVATSTILSSLDKDIPATPAV
jgi:raffinose/stachyose/melibiose transport system substrate-binding protein